MKTIMPRAAARAAIAAAAIAPMMLAAPTLASAAPSADARSAGETTAEVTFHNDRATTATCGSILHFFGSPLSWFGLPPAVAVPPGGSASQQIPFITPGIHTLSWWCDVPGDQVYTGNEGPVPVGGISVAIVEGINQLTGN
ncbi:hypothetical protein [Hoyosella subflava]|uniref:Secreted protein n=1 Tax=Hoyosella subflava (strain DSM 45089 / JCM 17490 / NBRC 109087 / DQS3-9A1) TaxID=443218 RepID=F6EKF0_HOYSD|nr:hypothetical protein [Hoyosella subflava]AEF39121.1 hypothetical protein AS9A_0667 [Hoyosella subflava DQS3-9A1]